MVILPLYQGSGNDGFFWGREMSPLRLRASELLRRLRVDRALGLLPGVRRDRAGGGRLWLDERAARLYPPGVFHMLGYRRMRRRGDQLVMDRQPGES